MSGLSALFHGDHPRCNLSELTGVIGGGVGDHPRCNLSELTGVMGGGVDVSSSKSVVKEIKRNTKYNTLWEHI